jgi:hypothetical protein
MLPSADLPRVTRQQQNESFELHLKLSHDAVNEIPNQQIYVDFLSVTSTAKRLCCGPTRTSVCGIP